MLYIKKHPETANGANQHDSLRQNGEASPRFTKETADRTGRAERNIQRDAERGEKVCPEALDLIRGTDLDKGTYLDNRTVRYP
ncbi:hypothetical protein [Enterovirga rhinocerotis]|uniref:Uncharacterized protein n=1 Tax=Enterovirga rhinocerotis TaxID=1339210 RepID=A0A4R7BWK4_9HYPH|nr:hypothetical protein [Enterovirga rhinocerotis]TDR89552.1 hypothetical protein EV668_2383 [Enterovirga rhinocerotis]